ncbi:hypothetical protein AgCh_016455 [Apium graveolens]
MLPDIDLGKPVEADTVQRIMNASREFGFQVINHGVLDDLISVVTKVFKEFFEMPVKESSDYGGNSNWVKYMSIGIELGQKDEEIGFRL